MREINRKLMAHQLRAAISELSYAMAELLEKGDAANRVEARLNLARDNISRCAQEMKDAADE